MKRKPRPKIPTDDDGNVTAETLRQALEDLGIDRPILSTRVVGSRLELNLYGGDVVYWPATGRGRRTT